MQISAVILTRNEKKNIERCLKSIFWCDEIIIIDDNSVDETIKIAKKFHAKVYKRNLNNNFSEQRNFGLSKVADGERSRTTNWVLFLDADEVISKSLQEDILKNTKRNIYNGFYLKRCDFFMGRKLKYGETGNIKLLRLAKKDFGKWERSVHETWEIKGKIGELENPIYHYPHETVREFLEDINTYSTLHAVENKKIKKARSVNIIIYPIGKFFVNYFLKLGFLDGVEGFVMAMFMSLHSFLSWSKAWLS